MSVFKLQVIVLFLGWMLLSYRLEAQCTFDVNADIVDLETVELQINVQGLVTADLSSDQAVCGVQLHFRHSYLGDLTIDLTSPSGQSVQLIGPVTDLITPTNLTTWDILFLPCGFPAAPDPGFNAQWSNDQPWQVFTTYTGSYHPALGCLEDFNTGSANGIWQLSITDHDAPQTGELLGLTLIFCDNTGLDCTVCGADAGVFPQSMLSLCEGSDVNIAPAYADTMPDADLYGYTFMHTVDSVNTSFSGQISTGSLLSGRYTICGISYAHADSTMLFGHLDTLTFDEIQTVFTNHEVGQCADITEVCITLNVSPFVDTTFLDMQICAGSSVSVGDSTYSTSGVHITSIDIPGACDSIVVLDLSIISVEARIVQLDTISCTNGVTMLDGSGSVAGPGATYQWSTLNGNITSASDQPDIMIDGGGTYFLIVTFGGCADSLSYDVIGDGSIPFVTIEGGVLDCNNPVYTFDAVIHPVGLSVEWDGPGGFSSNLLNPIVDTPGLYYLLVTNSVGCSASATAEVVLDTMTIIPSVVLTPDCVNGQTLVVGDPGNLEYQYSWTGPGGFTHPFRTFFTSQPGTYCATLTPPNGCPSTTCVDITTDYTIPDLMAAASGDTLHCNMTVDLTATSISTGVQFSWSGPSGVFASGPMVSVAQAGIYVVTASTPNGCVNRDTLTIVKGSDVFDVFTFGDTINCLKDTALIGAVTFAPSATFLWSGPGLVDTAMPFVHATAPGVYQVTVTSGGCTQVLLSNVTGDFSQPNFKPFTDTITCADPVAQLSMLISSPFTERRWQLPDGTVSFDSILQTTIPGLYILTVTAPSGCTGSRNAFVLADTLSPLLFIDSGLLGCDSTQIFTVVVDSIVEFNWSGPVGFVSTAANPFVSSGGSYILTATGVNGCTSQFVHTVETDLNVPDFQTFAEELDCLDSIAVLSMTSADSAAGYAWFFGGMQISDSAMVEIHEPGIYVAAVTGPNGCIGFDTVEVLPAIVPRVFTQTDTITCVSDVLLTVMSDLADALFTWEDQTGMTNTGPQYSTNTPGQITVTATGTNGCSHDSVIVVGIDTLSPIAVAFTNEMVLCNVQTITLDASQSVGRMLDFSWISLDGLIEAGASTPFPWIRGEGTYIVSVIDAVNGCEDTDTIQVVEGDASLGPIFLTVVPECEGNGNGSVSVDSVGGVFGTFTSLIDGMIGGPVFPGLSLGNYVVSVVDSFGCKTDTLIQVSNTNSMNSINLGEDQGILVGDSVLLEAIVDIDLSAIESIHWGKPVSCDTCLMNYVSPLQTTVYDIFLIDAFGCTAHDEVTVFVEEKGKYFIPNVFSPNGDNINDFLYVTTHPGVERVLSFSIYDRWGNVVFSAVDFNGKDVGVKWDGTVHGRDLNPAVFVYLLELKLVTGREEVFTGTVSLIK